MRLFTKLGWLPDSQPINFLRCAVQPVPAITAAPRVVLDAPQVDFGSGTGGGRRAAGGSFGTPNGRKLARWVKHRVPKKVRSYACR